MKAYIHEKDINDFSAFLFINLAQNLLNGARSSKWKENIDKRSIQIAIDKLEECIFWARKACK